MGRIVLLARRSQAAKAVPKPLWMAFYARLDRDRRCGETRELVVLKACEELRFTAMLEVLSMNPCAIATGQLMVSNLLIDPHRNDCCQIVVGIAFDEYGFPLAHETI